MKNQEAAMAAETRAFLDASRMKHLIAGQWVAQKDEKVADVFDPSTGGVITKIPLGGHLNLMKR